MSRIQDPTIRAAQFHGLADETRLRILDLLRSGEHCVCELMERLELGQSLLSFHLKTLKQAGLVTDRRQGRWMYYSLNESGIRDLGAALAIFKTTSLRRKSGHGCD